MKKNLIAKWHAFWGEYHFRLGAIAFAEGNTQGATLHLEKCCEHNTKYFDIVDNEEFNSN